MDRKYSIVIPSRSEQKLHDCILAIRDTGCEAPIIAVWDGKRTSVPIQFWNEFGSRIPVFVQGVEPFVFARNINLGIDAAGRGDVFLLNDDAIAYSNPDGLAAASRNVGTFGAVSAAIIGGAAAGHQSVSGELVLWGQTNPGQVAPVNHHMIAFVATYIRREVLDEVGPLDEQFVDYGYDDDDYCLRIRRRGYALGVYPGCLFEHGSVPSEFRGDQPAYMDKLAANQARFVAKWGAIPRDVVVTPDETEVSR